MGRDALSRSRRSGAPLSARRSVAIRPGATALSPIPSLATSRASPLVSLRGDPIHAREAARHASVVHQPLDRPQFPLRGYQESNHIGFAADVGPDRDGPTAGRNNMAHHFHSRGLAAHEIHRHGEAASAGKHSNRRANAAARPGHDQSSTHFVILAQPLWAGRCRGGTRRGRSKDPWRAVGSAAAGAATQVAPEPGS
jgi:hypothetical protein